MGRLFYLHFSIMVIPPLLKKSDKIGIVAPARKVVAGDLEFAVRLFNSWGLQVELSKNIFSNHHSYHAGSTGERSADLQSMIHNPDIRAIISARGGYGTTQILDDIDLSPLQKDPKWIIGFSDITALHLALVQKGIASIHGAMPILFTKPNAGESMESLGRLLMKGQCQIGAGPTRFNRLGEADGMMIGGNLSLLVDALGTPTEPDTNEKILFIEEVDEYLYKVDRMMTQLRRAGKLKRLRALVVGYMTDLKDSELTYGELVQQIVLKAVESYDYPVAFHIPAGHDNPNHAWIHGGVATLSVTGNGTRIAFPEIRGNT